MSIKIVAVCDFCAEELDMEAGEKAIDYEGWGTVFGYDEDYCHTCWPTYCHQYGVDPKTGKDIQGVIGQQEKGCHLAKLD